MKVLLCLLLCCVTWPIVSAQSPEQTQNPEFVAFMDSLNTYRTVRDSVLVFPDCKYFVLAWQVIALDPHVEMVIPSGRVSSLCAHHEESFKIPQDQPIGGYGSWTFSTTYIGNRYVIITGNRAVSLFEQVRYYFVRK